MSTDMTDTTAIRLVCRECGSGDLATIEKLIGNCDSSFRRDADGELIVDGHGYTEVNWDTSETVGVRCNGCDAESTGEDWAGLLVPAGQVETGE